MSADDDLRRGQLADALWRDESTVTDDDGLATVIGALRALLDDEAPASGPDADGRFGRYVASRPLGAGGMGEVWIAHDPELDREVAIKVLAPGAGSREHVLARFLDEGRVTGQLEHPGILPIHDVGHTKDGEPFVCMKLVRGLTLEDRLLALDGDAARAAARAGLLDDLLKVCDAVAFAHARGVIHRDLKPANIICGEFGEVLVLDWGLARRIDRAPVRPDRPTDAPADAPADRTQDGMLLGTPAYMSPEQADGRAAEADARSDVYALGAVLYQILTGAAPFEGPSTQALLADICAGKLLPPTQRAPRARIPRELSAITLRAMAIAPADRYASAGELRADLVRGIAGHPVHALRYSPLARLAKWAGRRRVALLAAGAAALLVIAAGAHDQWQGRRRIVGAALVHADAELRSPIAGEPRSVAIRLAGVLELIELARVAARDDPQLHARQIALLRRLARAWANAGEPEPARQALRRLETLGAEDLQALRDEVERAGAR